MPSTREDPHHLSVFIAHLLDRVIYGAARRTLSRARAGGAGGNSEPAQ